MDAPSNGKEQNLSYLIVQCDEYQINENQILQKDLCICVLSIQKENLVEYTQNLQITTKSEPILKHLNSRNSLLKFSFKNNTNMNHLGSVSFPFDLFFNNEEKKSISQWF